MSAPKIIVHGSGDELQEGDEDHHPDVEAGDSGGTTTTSSTQVAAPGRGRLVSLDVFRGITVAVSELSTFLAIPIEYWSQSTHWKT